MIINHPVIEGGTLSAGAIGTTAGRCTSTLEMGGTGRVWRRPMMTPSRAGQHIGRPAMGMGSLS